MANIATRGQLKQLLDAAVAAGRISQAQSNIHLAQYDADPSGYGLENSAQTFDPLNATGLKPSVNISDLPLGQRALWREPTSGWLAREWGEDYPESLYRGMLGTGGSQNFLKYWQNQFGNVFSDFWGSLGKKALGGEFPAGTWYDYMKDYPFEKEWQKLAPWTRGAMPSPGARWNIPR